MACPTAIAVFDGDREPLDFDGEVVMIEGVEIALVIPAHDGNVAD